MKKQNFNYKIPELIRKNMLVGLRSLGRVYTACLTYHLTFNNLNKKIAKQLAIFLFKVSLFIINKSKISETLFIPCKNDLYVLFAWLICLLIIPTFYFNIYIIGINIDSVKLGKLFLIVLFSCADIYILLLLGINIWFQNMNNLYKSILHLLVIIINKKTLGFFFTTILSIVLFLFLIGICLWGLNVIILYLGLYSTSLTTYLWLRLTLSPFIFYLFNLFISIYKLYDLENTELDLSIFSSNMFKGITLFRILFLTSFVCFFYSIKFLYIYYFLTKIINNFNILSILKNVDLKYVNLYPLDINLEGIDLDDLILKDKKYDIKNNCFYKTIIGKSLQPISVKLFKNLYTYNSFASKFLAKDLWVTWLQPLQPVNNMIFIDYIKFNNITTSNSSEVICINLVSTRTHFYSLSLPKLNSELDKVKLLEFNKTKEFNKIKELLPVISLNKTKFELPNTREINLPSFFLYSNNKIMENLIKNTNKNIQIFTSQIDHSLLDLEEGNSQHDLMELNVDLLDHNIVTLEYLQSRTINLDQHSDNHNLFPHPPNTITMDVTIWTTRPIIGDNLPLPILSDRLIIRSYRISDLEAYHTLLSQPEAMGGENMSPNLSYTKSMLEEELEPCDSQIYLGIFLNKSDGNEGDLIGDGGMHHLRTQGEWPELSYRFKKEYWNEGYATEFAIAFMQFWWSIPREPTRLRVRSNSVGFQDTPLVVERVYASVKQENKASKRVLEKARFELFDVKMLV